MLPVWLGRISGVLVQKVSAAEERDNLKLECSIGKMGCSRFLSLVSLVPLSLSLSHPLSHSPSLLLPSDVGHCL